jgi:uncharacterized protein YjbI with pentapeptide repeats
MTNPPDPLDPIAQLVAKYQTNEHQTPAPQSQLILQPNKGWTGFAGRTLWDWLNLLGVLLIPLILGAGTLLITAQQSAISQSQHESDQKIADNRLQEDLLKTYRDDIYRLMFDQQLPNAKYGDPVQTMAQSYTNDALRKLDLSRRILLAQFLNDLHLVSSTTENPPLLSLSGTDLRGVHLPFASLQKANLNNANLQGADLHGAKLQRANLHGANLHGAKLQVAYLQGAYLDETDLQGAYLDEADLQGIRLRGTNLQGAQLGRTHLQGAQLLWVDLSDADLQQTYLQGAQLLRVDLRGADLRGANLQKASIHTEQLATAKYLKGATLPDGSRYPSESYPIPGHQEPTN